MNAEAKVHTDEGAMNQWLNNEGFLGVHRTLELAWDPLRGFLEETPQVFHYGFVKKIGAREARRGIVRCHKMGPLKEMETS